MVTHRYLQSKSHVSSVYRRGLRAQPCGAPVLDVPVKKSMTKLHVCRTESWSAWKVRAIVFREHLEERMDFKHDVQPG